MLDVRSRVPTQSYLFFCPISSVSLSHSLSLSLLWYVKPLFTPLFLPTCLLTNHEYPKSVGRKQHRLLLLRQKWQQKHWRMQKLQRPVQIEAAVAVAMKVRQMPMQAVAAKTSLRHQPHGVTVVDALKTAVQAARTMVADAAKTAVQAARLAVVDAAKTNQNRQPPGVRAVGAARTVPQPPPMTLRVADVVKPSQREKLSFQRLLQMYKNYLE